MVKLPTLSVLLAILRLFAASGIQKIIVYLLFARDKLPPVASSNFCHDLYDACVAYQAFSHVQLSRNPKIFTTSSSPRSIRLITVKIETFPVGHEVAAETSLSVVLKSVSKSWMMRSLLTQGNAFFWSMKRREFCQRFRERPCSKGRMMKRGALWNIMKIHTPPYDVLISSRRC